jgi:hypothetical protein
MPGTGNRPRFCLVCSVYALECDHPDMATAALEEYIQHRRQTRILEAFGTVDFDLTYHCQAERTRKRLK